GSQSERCVLHLLRDPVTEQAHNRHQAGKPMAENFLSQDEVDALLRGVTGDVDEPARDQSQEGVRPYNLATQERIVRGRMPTLEIINDRFGRLLRIALFNFLHRTAEVAIGPVRVQKY